MRYRQIPGTDLAPSVICLGTSKYGDTINRQMAYDLMDQYVSAGGNFLDTAKVYGEWVPGSRSLSEEIIGEWLVARNNRHQIILATKGGHPDLNTMHIPRLSRQNIFHDIEASLTHLKTDYIDLYWVHRDEPSRPVEDIIETMNDLVKDGKIRYFGCSNWRSERVDAAQKYAWGKNIKGFAANQMKWSLAAYPSSTDPSMVNMDDTEYDYHIRTGLTAIPYNSQAGGFFSGKYTADMLWNRSAGTEKLNNLCSEQNIQRLQRAADLSERMGLTLTQVSLGYLLYQPFPVFPICGCSTPAQVVDSCSAGDVKLDMDAVNYLENNKKQR